MLLSALLSFTAAAANPPASLFAVVGPKHEHVTQLIRHENASVVLHHADFTVVEANGTLPSLPSPTSVVFLGHEIEGMRYFVLSHRLPKRNISAALSDAEWAREVKSRNQQLKIVFRNASSFLLMANPADFPDVASSEDAEADNVFEGLQLPAHTHFMPLYSRGLTESAHNSNQAIASRAAKHSSVGEKNPIIERLVEDVSAEQLEQTVSHLSQTWNTRQAATQGANDAAVYLREQFVSEDFDVELDHFDERWGPNVIATKVSAQNPHTWVVVGAHYDSRGRDRSSLTETAPGANDDGSGIAMLLELARITKVEALTYEYSLKIVAFSAEEQGLFGSTAVANRMKDAGEEIIAMYAADMIGYRVPGRNIQVGLPIVYHTPAITDLAEEVMTLYVPDMEVCEYTGCCTDNKPFYDVGFPNSRFFEACGALDDPMYHTPEDAFPREGYGDDGNPISGTLQHVVRGILATVWVLLEPSLE